MTPEQFVEKWSAIDQSETAVSKAHFADLCGLLGQPTPPEADPAGESYAYEKHVLPLAAASRGSKGFGGYVDVWKRDALTRFRRSSAPTRSVRESPRTHRDAVPHLGPAA